MDCPLGAINHEVLVFVGMDAEGVFRLAGAGADSKAPSYNGG